jgi:hypothetical protein
LRNIIHAEGMLGFSHHPPVKLVKRWKNGDTQKSLGVSDNRSVGPAVAGEGLRCVLGEKVSLADGAAAK